MALTLFESAKLDAGNEFRSAVVEMYARTSNILMVLPFMDINGSAYAYNREQTLPGVGFRGINEAFAESTGVLNPLSEKLVPFGGDIRVDRFIIQTSGVDQQIVQERMKIKSMALNWTSQFIKGDAVADPRGFDGLQVRVTGNQLIPNATAAGGGALSLQKLDELIDTVDGANYLIMNKTMRRLLTGAARTSGISGIMLDTYDLFGIQVTRYNGIPILLVENDAEDQPIMAFNEAAAGGGTAQCSSIYAVRFEEGYLTGLQNGNMDVRELGEDTALPQMVTRIDWNTSIAPVHGRSVGRLSSITNAPVVA